ncbi:MAG TPA: prepilin peptidase [Firmicutes bacterium]|jgi:leader peptidase (prepilin peptidase) / N-methyltransferase|nr:prepilin peptidase [Bacillota bacterium]
MIIIILVYGLVIGSFLNVCIYRIPHGMSIVFPHSFCPNCQSRIKWYDLFPVISYLILGGRCRNCRTFIGIQYPLVEIFTAGIGVGLYFRFGLNAIFLKYIILFCLLIVIAGIDLQHRVIPNILSISGMIIGLLWAVPYGGTDIFHAVLGMAVGGLILLPLAYFYPQGMGMGDVKLLAMIGSFVGAKVVLAALFCGSALGTVIGLILIGSKVITRKTPIPFGPFLAVGALVSVIILN